MTKEEFESLEVAAQLDVLWDILDAMPSDVYDMMAHLDITDYESEG